MPNDGYDFPGLQHVSPTGGADAPSGIISPDIRMDNERGRDFGICSLLASCLLFAWVFVKQTGVVDYYAYAGIAYGISVLLCLLDREYVKLGKKPYIALPYAFMVPAYLLKRAFYLQFRGFEKYGKFLAWVMSAIVSILCEY